MLAVIRPSSWDPLLFIHVFGAMALVATVILATFAVRKAHAAGDQPSTRFAARILTMGVLPAYIVMRVGAQLIVDKEKLGDSKEAWIGIGFGVSDFGLVLLLAAMIITGLTARKARKGTSVQGATSLKVASGLTYLLVVMYVVAIYAMTTKPT